jgi:cytochrome c-type biogenesis protein CcmH/NrfF
MPPWLVWLLPVPVATLGAIAWTSWASRVRRPVAAVESVQAYEKFRKALNAPVPAPRTETPNAQKAGSGS